MSNYLFAIGESSKIDILKSKYSYSKEVTVTEISNTVSALTVEKIAETIQNYEQCIVTSAESESVPRSLFKNSTILEINHGIMTT